MARPACISAPLAPRHSGRALAGARRMSETFTICSWVLVAIGIAMTAWLCPRAWAFVPYMLLPFAIRAARRFTTRSVVLLVTLLSVCIGFWFHWDAAFIHLSTLNLIPFEVVVVESLVAIATWLVVRRVERVTHDQNAG